MIECYLAAVLIRDSSIHYVRRAPNEQWGFIVVGVDDDISFESNFSCATIVAITMDR